MTASELPSKHQTVPQPGRYRIDTDASTVAIRTRHLFGLGPVRATIALRDGRVQVAARPEESAVTARFAVSTFQSGNPARDAAVLSPRLLDAEVHPSITFIATDLIQAQDHQVGAQQTQWVLRGELEVRGVTRLVEVRLADLAEYDGTLRATAQVDVDRYDFGVTAYRGLAARRLTVHLDITAHREPQS